MNEIIPPQRPQITREQVMAMIGEAGLAARLNGCTTFLFGRRGYYRRTMGPTPGNDRGLYDDAIVLVSPRIVRPFNANTDPSRYQPGIATLKCGLWSFKPGIHHPGTPGAYPCLVQAGPVTVVRDGGVEETGEFYIHHHRGGENTTSSLGCQTIVPSQWVEYYGLTIGEMKQARVSTIPYLLTEGT